MTLVIAWIALAISVLSALIAAYAALIADKAQKKAHKHDRLSVIPHLVYQSSITENGPFVKIINSGLGPAKIIKLKVFFENNFIEDANDCGWEYVRKQLIPFQFKYFATGFHEGECLAVGNLENLIAFRPKENSQNTSFEQAQFVRALKKIKFEIEYESFYGDKQEPVVWDGSINPLI